jgi:DDE family transposase
MTGVRLKTVRRLGYKDRLVKWSPSDRQWKHLPASINLRVIEYQVKGFRPSAIVTNQTNPRRLNRDQWMGLAASNAAGPRLNGGLYHCRWQIETTFAELKVRQGMERSLRGHTPQAIRFEVAGHVLLYLLTRWLMVEAAVKHGQDPLRLSFTNALRELQDMHQTLLTANPVRLRTVLLPRLLRRISEWRVPDRPGRHYLRPNDTKIKKQRLRQTEITQQTTDKKSLVPLGNAHHPCWGVDIAAILAIEEVGSAHPTRAATTL